MRVNLSPLRKALAVALAGAAALLPRPARAQMDATIQMLLGNPSNATTSVLNESNYLIQRPEYALAYSRWDGIPRWVAWHLSSLDFGSATRQQNFFTDNSLPSGWYRVTDKDYSNSGYSRGHMCPSADRLVTDYDNDQLFYMTNIVPQTQENNGGPWDQLENYCRSLATAGNELYIICGPRGYNGRLTTASGNVTIPKYLWKVIVVIPKLDGDDVARIATTTRVIAVDMPNEHTVTSDWKVYRVSVDAIEAATGLDFFSNVPAAVQNVIEAKVDNQ